MTRFSIRLLFVATLTLLPFTSNVAFADSRPPKLKEILQFAENEMLTLERLPDPGNVLSEGMVYDFSNSPVDWLKGYVTLFVGTRSATCAPGAFVDRVSSHVHEFSQELGVYGLQGYLVFIGEDYEIAWQSWVNRESAEQAFRSDRAQPIIEAASGFMDSAFYEEMNWKTKEPELKK